MRLERRSGDVLKVEEGSLSPALYRTEQRGWLTSEWSVTDTGRRARFYRLTRAGRVQLAAEAASWDRLPSTYPTAISREIRRQVLLVGSASVIDSAR